MTKKARAYVSITLGAMALVLVSVVMLQWYGDRDHTAAILSGTVQELTPFIPERTPTPVPTLASFVKLAVPYVNEAPDGNWTGSWKNGCEEAAIVMIERFYKGETSVSIPDARRSLQHLFNYQDGRWGSDANSDAARTAEIANALGLFKAEVVTNPTLQAMKAEVAAGRPVLSLHKGFDLGNPNIPFLATGSSYHTLVLIGYDDTTGEFITHDDGDEKAGEGRRYTYDVVMNSLHDYNYNTRLTDGPPRVIFTAP